MKRKTRSRTARGALARQSAAHRRKTAGTSLLGDGKRVIAVFGASAAHPGDGLYEDGYRMGQLLARAGFNVMTGGYQGLMEAVSRGAHDNNARVIGVTLTRFEEQANSYVMEEISTASFYTRFRWLIDRADGYVAMHGGMGTLAEISFAWQKLALDILTVRPFILTGADWRAVFNVFKRHLTTKPEDYDVIGFANTPEDACRMLQDFFANGPIVHAGASELTSARRE